MTHLEANVPTLGMFPFSTMKTQVEAEPNRPFIVDVGGGNGHVLMLIQREAPNGFGAEMVLQDLPHVIDSIDQESISGLTKMVHNFNTPQPIKSGPYNDQVFRRYRLTTYRCPPLLLPPHLTQLPKRRL